jgi:ribosomal-protein-serine acetyltransferase
MNDNPIIETGDIKLRHIHPSDTEALYEAVEESITELSPWMPWCTKDYSIKESKTWCESREDAWNKKEAYDFLIIDKRDETLLGVCGINNINAEVSIANLGYWVRTGRTGEGIATAVVPMLAKFGFENLKLCRLEIVVAEGNLPSQCVAEKAGAIREGLLRRRLNVHGKSLDAFMFSIIPDDFI